MSTIVLGPAEALSRALADEFGGVTVIDGPGAAGDAMWQALVALQAAHAAMAGAYPWAESATPGAISEPPSHFWSASPRATSPGRPWAWTAATS
jgi:hypothetical protein